MGLVLLYVALAALQGTLGLWVLLVAPRATLNRALAALMLLLAGSGIVFQMYREAADALTFVVANRAASMYEIPAGFLMLLIADLLFLPQPRSARRRAGLAAAGVVTVAYAAVYFLSVARMPPAAGVPGVAGSFVLAYEFLPDLNNAALLLVEVAVVVLAAIAASDHGRGPLQRRQAGLVGIAFFFLAAHAAAVLVSPLLPAFVLPAHPLGFAVRLAVAPVLLVCAPRLVQPFAGRARWAAWVAVAAPFLGGVADFASPYWWALGARVLPNLTSRFMWASAFGLALSLAVVRYDLAGIAGHAHKRMVVAADLIFSFGLAGVAGGAALSALGLTASGVALAALCLASPLLLHWVRNAPSGLLLDPGDPEVVRERVRIYGQALASAVDPGGRVAAPAEPALRALRGQLGISQRDHELLLSRGAAGADAVAYRVALETAAASGDLDADAPHLRTLRRQLAVNEREHALMLDDVRASEARPAMVPGARVLARYMLVKELGRGGFGEAFLARDERTRRDVVLKRLGAEHRRSAVALQRFRQEIRMARALRHPHIVEVFDVAFGGGDAFLVMEHVAGGSLADRVRDRGPLGEADAVRLGLDVLAALEALHGRGIVHRDVKPSNILLDARGRAKLGDFTLAQEVVSGETLGARPGAPLGTLAYMAPEQARGLPAGKPADLYGLAATLAFAVQGAPPVAVAGLSEFEAVLRVIEAPPALPAGSAAFVSVLGKALSKDPAARHASASAMAAELRKVDAGAFTPRGTRAGSAPRRRRHPA